MAAMNDGPHIDFEQLMERLRRNIQLRKVQRRQPDAPTGDLQLETDLSVVLSEYDLFATQLRTRGGPLGLALIAVRRVLKVLLAPMLQRQARYNAATARLISDLARQLDEAELANSSQVQSLAQMSIEIETLRASDHETRAAVVRADEETRGIVEERIAEVLRSVADGSRLVAQTLNDLQLEQSAIRQALGVLGNDLAAAQIARCEELARRIEALAQRETEFGDRLSSIDREHSHALQAARERIVEAERKLRRIAFSRASSSGHEADSRVQPPAGNGTGSVPQADAAASGVNGDQPDDGDYLRFEDRFRGSEENVKQRQQRYVEYFRGRARVLDFGCGRGEFLELLRDAGMEAQGVDLNIDMALLCREKRLDVVHADGLKFLDGQPDGALGGIFAAQVIEHLTPDQTSALVRLAYRKLRPGGALVLETLNPESLLVQYRWFWMDMSHKRLVHPEALRFMFESAGFENVMTHFVEPPEGPLSIPAIQLGNQPNEALDRFNRATDYLNRLLYGSSDYAVVGTK